MTETTTDILDRIDTALADLNAIDDVAARGRAANDLAQELRREASTARHTEAIAAARMLERGAQINHVEQTLNLSRTAVKKLRQRIPAKLPRQRGVPEEVAAAARARSNALEAARVTALAVRDDAVLTLMAPPHLLQNVQVADAVGIDGVRVAQLRKKSLQ